MSWACFFVPTKRMSFPLLGDRLGELQGVLEDLDRLLQVDDVDAVALAVDEFLHLRVPPLGLVAEMHPGFQQFLHCDLDHVRSPFRYRL